MKIFFKKVWPLILSLLAIGLVDRLAKKWCLNNLPVDGIPVIPNFLNLTVYRNINVAMGIRIPQPWLFILIGLILVMLLSLLVNAWRRKDHWLIFWLGLVIIGATNNLADRLFYGAVIDIIEIPFWSVFNLADLMVVSGILGWLIKNIWFKEEVSINKTCC